VDGSTDSHERPGAFILSSVPRDTPILPYDRLESVTKSVTKWQLSLALRDDVPLKKIQLMGQIDALCKFDFFNRLAVLCTPRLVFLERAVYRIK
jgi:hypothetical protein